MKSIAKFITIILFFLGISACEDTLDLQPQNELSEAKFWQSEEDLTAAVNGTYEVMLVARETYQHFGALDVYTPIGIGRSGNNRVIGNGTYSDDLWVLENRWQAGFRGVVRASDVLDHVDQMTNVDEEIRNERKGEALFLRAWYYFNLVYFFGDLPKITTVPTLEQETMSRSPKSDIVDVMLSDLSEIIDNNYLPVSRDEQKGRATLGAALFLKAKIHMMEHQYSEAVNALETLMNLGVYALNPDFIGIWSKDNEHNSEVIFNLESFAGSGDSKFGSDWDKLFSSRGWGPQGGGWSRAVPTTYLLDLYETKEGESIDPDTVDIEDYLELSYYNNRDPRLDMTVVRPGDSVLSYDNEYVVYPDDLGGGWRHSQSGLHMRKFITQIPNDYTNWDSPKNWIYFRYADALLMYAEARLEASSTSENGIINDVAIYDALNQVRQRPSVNMPAISEDKTKSELRNIIRRERPRELALEGWYFFDLIRWDVQQEMIDGFEVWSIRTKQIVETRVFENRHKLWPVPLSERLLNPNLGNNPGWPE